MQIRQSAQQFTRKGWRRVVGHRIHGLNWFHHGCVTAVLRKMQPALNIHVAKLVWLSESEKF